MTEQRRLAAILVADVVGYSKLVGGDEAGTLARLSALKSEVIEPTIAKHSGRLFKAVGDGFLVEFASAVQAVACAVAIQKAGPALPLRIGIHLGDVIVQGDDLLGDGVNIAARVEGVADSGGIAISRAVHEQVRDRLDVAFADKGEIALKNIVRPVHVFALSPTTAPAIAPSLALPDKPSIAVLPFQNMSGDPEQEYFADGVVEDIITALSRFKSLFVIARNSSFTYKGRAVDIKQVGRELGVRYVLEGSVRRASDRVRITAQLIDAISGAHLWADRFDGSLDDIFALQDSVTSHVVGQLLPTVEQAEIERALGKSTADLGAYDHFLRGMAELYKQTKASTQCALDLYREAIRIDPQFAAPYAWAVIACTRRMQSGWVQDRAAEFAEAVQLGRKAIELGKDDPVALTCGGFAIAFMGDNLEAGLAFIDRALSLNPNLALAWHGSGWVRTYLGEPEIAATHLKQAMRLSPLDPNMTQVHLALAIASRCAGRYEEAAAWASKVVQEVPDLVPAQISLAASLALAGRIDEAKQAMNRALQLAPKNLGTDPDYWFSLLRRPQDRESSRRGALLAGMPDGTKIAASDTALPLPDKPSIAVLPFQNMSGDPEQEYFADGIVEDIITALSRFKDLFVIARNSSFSYKGKSPDVRKVGQELGVRYVLEGSIRKSSHRIRVTGQLIDSLTGSHIWAERYDRVLEDVFEVQEELTQSIVRAIVPHISDAELNKVRRRRPDSLGAYEIAVRASAKAWDAVVKSDPVLCNEAIAGAQAALAIDPDSTIALNTLAASHTQHLMRGTTADRRSVWHTAIAAATRAIELDRTDGLSHSWRAMLLVIAPDGSRMEEAVECARRSHELNPHDSRALIGQAYVETLAGNPERAIELLLHALRVSPRDPMRPHLLQQLSLASFAARRYADGVDYALRGLAEAPLLPPLHVFLATNYVGLGEVGKARAAMAEARRLGPQFVERHLTGTLYGVGRERAQMFARIAAGLEQPSAAEPLL